MAYPFDESGKAYLDYMAKKYILNPQVLCLILKKFVKSCQSLSKEELLQLTSDLYHDHFSNLVHKVNSEQIINDQYRFLDVPLDLKIGNQVIHVDIELQSSYKHDLEIRNARYIYMMLAKQELEKNDSLEKVIIIWINMSPPGYLDHTILCDRDHRYDLITGMQFDTEYYQFVPSSIMINLYNINNVAGADILKEENKVMRVLSILFSKTIDNKAKIAILEAEGIHLLDDKKEVSNVAYLADGFIQMGVEQGIQRGIQQGIEQGIQQGIEQGVEQGIKQGQKQAKAQIALETKDVAEMLSKGKSEDDIYRKYPDFDHDLLETLQMLKNNR